MIVQLPRGPAHGSAVLVGWTRRATDATAVLRGAAVLKAAYDLEPDGTGPRRMVQVDDAARAVVAVEDTGTPLAGGGYDLTREADTALEKELTDIVVEGHVDPPEAGGCVHVGGQAWLHRAVAVPVIADTSRNLFGWTSKTEAPRRIDVTGFDATDGEGLPATYTPLFNNVHRRGVGFSSPGERTTAPLPSGALVQIFQTASHTDDPYAFTLPDLARTARLRASCGHGPDQPRRWRVAGEVPLVPDTLVVRPAEHRATVVWRASWNHLAGPPERWRAVEVLTERSV